MAAAIYLQERSDAVMHEMSLMQNLFDLTATYAREYRFKKINRIVVRIGELSGVSHDALQFAFAAVSTGSVAHGAEFVIETVPARARCLNCGTEFAVKFTSQECRECKHPARLVSGRELHLQTIEGDQEDELNAS